MIVHIKPMRSGKYSAWTEDTKALSLCLAAEGGVEDLTIRQSGRWEELYHGCEEVIR